ncbi:protoporphyrinogen/coproporphyrinogen oxidase [Aureimonas ureilytica]|uniref:protoporphyrinogen/coproporphyrinogen oxidase n=1 Tax=Aureimonas ureilytica TaxID=401562 RepID=UPI00036271BE|nr:FAD-dependent oxidoreductase [Aureimonas ureilytica]
MKPIAIIGAGLAGLTAAAELQRRGLPVIVFEAGKAIGGMAASFKDKDGFAYDFGAHFITNRLATALGAADTCRTVKHYGEAVLLNGRFRNYPLGLLFDPRFAASAVKARLTPAAPARSAADLFRANYGGALAEAVAIPLAEAWSGAAARDLAPAVGQKFGAGIAKSIYLNVAARVSGRAVSNGYSHEMPESAGVYHVYPEGGLAKLLEPTVQAVRASIRMESPVERIVVRGERVVAVRVRGEEIPVSAAISTAPVNVLPKIVEGTDALDALAAFRYRPMAFVNLRFSGRAILPDTMLWVPDRQQRFFRVTEAPISMPWLAPEGKTLLTYDLGCEVGDETWRMADEDLAELCLEGTCRIFGNDLRKRYLGAGGTLRTPIAYPVFLSSYESARQRFAQDSGVAGLYSIGRHGEFAHILMEDIYWRTLRRMNDVAAYVGDRQASGSDPVRDLMGVSSELLDSLAGSLQPAPAPHA